jgi:hypothetical protein
LTGTSAAFSGTAQVGFVSGLKTWYTGIDQLAIGANSAAIVANASYIGIQENSYLNASGQWKKVNAGGASNVWQDNGTIYFRTAVTGGSADDNINYHYCVMTPTGEFGVNTSAPGSYKLYVNGTLKVTGASALDDITCEDVSPRDVLSARNITASTGTFSSYIAANGGIKDDGGDYGTNGQVLSTNGSNAVNWVDQSSGGGSGDITSVIGGNAIDVSGGTSGDATVNHADTSTQATVNNSNNYVVQDITLDTYGHVTAINSKNIGGQSGTPTIVNDITSISTSGCSFTINFTRNGSTTSKGATLSCGGGGS